MDELRRIWFRECCWNNGEQGLHLDLAMVSKARCDASQVGVVVAGMADELEWALRRDGVHDFRECCPVQVASGRDPKGPLGCLDVPRMDRCVALECRPELVQNSDLHSALKTGMREPLRKFWLKRVAYRTDARSLKDVQQRATDPGEEMGVLVSIDVRDRDTGLLQLADLSLGLSFDVALANMTTQQGMYEGQKGRAKAPSVRTDQRWNLRRIGRRYTVGENDMAADAERGGPPRNLHGVVKGWSGGHQGCRGQHACVMQREDRAIDSFGQSKVVGIDDELRRH